MLVTLTFQLCTLVVKWAAEAWQYHSLTA